MKQIVASILGIFFITVPLFAFAATLEDTQLQIRNLLTAIAVLKAEKERAPVACAAIASSQSVAIHEPFVLLWSSYGSTDAPLNLWAPSGAFTIAISEPGIRQYKLDFYSKDGRKATCTVVVSIHR